MRLALRRRYPLHIPCIGRQSHTCTHVHVHAHASAPSKYTEITIRDERGFAGLTSRRRFRVSAATRQKMTRAVTSLSVTLFLIAASPHTSGRDTDCCALCRPIKDSAHFAPWFAPCATYTHTRTHAHTHTHHQLRTSWSRVVRPAPHGVRYLSTRRVQLPFPPFFPHR